MDAFLTADLRHHPASEATPALARSALVDAAHWATEWPWCEQAAAQLDEISDRHGWDLRVHVSQHGHRPLDRPRAVPSPTPLRSPGAPN